MKAAAIILAIILALSVCGVGYLYMTANVTVTAVGVTATEASVQQAAFDNLAEDLAQGSLVGTVFQSNADLGASESYLFYTYTVRLKNNCMLTCDMVEMQVTPRDGDVLQIGTDTASALAPGTTGDINATILTTVESGSTRELIVTYYVWGIPFSLRTTCV